MGDELERLTVAVGADTGALVSGFGSIGPLVGKLTGMLGGASAIIAAAVAGAAVAIGVFAFKAAQEIDKGTDAIRAGTGATGKALDELSGNMKNVGKDVPASFDVIGGAVADLNTRLGLTGKPLEDMTKQMINLGRITGEDVSELIRNTTRVFGDWNIATEDQADSLDYLYKTSQSTGIGVSKLSDLVVTFGAPFRQLGFSFEETAALMGKWEKEGVNVEKVAGGMRIALGKMAAEGKEPVAEMQRLTDSIKNAGSAGEANAIAVEAFGSRAGPDMAAAIREGRFEIDELMGSIAGSGDTINKAAEDTWDFGERLTILGNNAKVILEPIGKGIMIALDWAVKGIIKAIKWVSELITKLKTGGGAFKKARDVIQQVFDTIKTIFTVYVKIILELWNRFGKQIFNQIKAAFTFIWNMLKAAFKIIKGIWDVFAGIFSGDWSRVWNGIKAIFGGIWDAIKAIFIFVWNTIKNYVIAAWHAITGIAKVIWEGIKAYFQACLNIIAAFFGSIWNGIKAVVTGIWNAIVAVAKAIWEGIKIYFTVWLAVIKAIFTTVWNVIKGVLSGVWNAIKFLASSLWEGIKVMIWNPIKWVWDKLVSTWNTIKGVLSGVWNTITSIAAGAWNAIKSAIWTPIEGAWNLLTGVLDKIKGGLSAAWSSITGAASTAWGAIAGVVSAAWDGVVSVIESGINLAIKVINAFIRGYNAIPLLGDIGTISPVRLGRGGIVTGPTLALLGESGPEAVTPLPRSGAGGLGDTNVMAVFQSVSEGYDSDRLVDLVSSKLARSANHTGRLLRKGQ